MLHQQQQDEKTNDNTAVPYLSALAASRLRATKSSKCRARMSRSTFLRSSSPLSALGMGACQNGGNTCRKHVVRLG